MMPLPLWLALKEAVTTEERSKQANQTFSSVAFSKKKGLAVLQFLNARRPE
jgi:hypothetical protein